MRFFLILPFLFLLIHVNAQQGTTLEEYRYLTKGYAYQKGLGLDAVKEGYDFKALYTAKNEVEFVGMYRLGNQDPQAILCIFDKGISPNSFLCLPNNAAEKDIVALCDQDRNSNLSYEKRKLLDKALSELLFVQMGENSTSNAIVQAPVPSSYQQTEVFTPRGGGSEPLVASAKSAPAYPIQPRAIESADPWEGLPITATETPAPVNYDYVPSPSSNTTATPNATNLKMDFSLNNRPVVHQAPMVTNTRKTGKVVVKLCVNQSGEVVSSKFTQRGSTSLDATLIQLAVDNASQIRFKESHLPEQCGTISYIFNL